MAEVAQAPPPEGSRSHGSAAAFTSSPAPSSQFTVRPGKIVLTRMQLLEYMHQRAWWRVAQMNLIFTIVLWATFLAQIYLRADVFDAFQVKEGLVQHVKQIIAHPSVSQIPFMQHNEVEIPCRCACRSAKFGTPPTVCPTEGAEVLDFSGRLDPNATGAMLGDACTDVSHPLIDYNRYLSANMSNFSCWEWRDHIAAAVGDEDADQTLARETLCTPSKFQAFLHDRFTGKDWVNDTDHHFLHQLGDFDLPRWKCPATCNACQHNIATGMQPLSWDDVSSIDDVWLWLEHGLIPDIFEGKTNNPSQSRAGILARRNLLIGGLRARQIRSEESYTCNVRESLQTVYRPACRSLDPAENYVAPGASGSLSQKSLELTGAYTPAVADEKGTFDAFFEVERDRKIALELATQLRNSKWLDTATNELRVEGLALNAEAGFFALVTMTFHFRYDGVVDKHLETHSLQIITHFDLMDYIPEFIWLGLIGILFIQELLQVMQFCWQRKFKEYVSDGWNLVDWFSIILGVGLTLLWWVIVSESIALADEVIALPRSVEEGSSALATYRSLWTGLLDSARGLRATREAHLFLMFVYSTIITLRFMKGFLGQQKLAMIQNSLAAAAQDVIHFQIVFVILFVTFVLGGHVLFGVALKEWSTVAGAMSATIKMLMGAFHFEVMYAYAPWSATVWFWLFLIIMIFLLLRLLTAMMVVHFGKFRKTIGPTDTILYDAWHGLRDFVWRSEWRWDSIMMREFLGAVANPYEDLIEGVAEKACVSDEMSEMMGKSVLGIRLARSKADVLTAGMADEKQKNDASLELVKEKVMQKELRTIGADATVADHVISECDKSVKRHATWTQKLQNLEVERCRFFLKMLRNHADQLVGFCDQVESGVTEEMTYVIDGLEVLEGSISEAFEGLMELRTTEVDSLALCPPNLPYVGTSIRDDFMKCLGHQPPRKGTAPVPGRGGVTFEDPRFALEGPRFAADTANEFFALGNNLQIPEGPTATDMPAALLDHGEGRGAIGDRGAEAAAPDPEQLALPGVGDGDRHDGGDEGPEHGRGHDGSGE